MTSKRRLRAKSCEEWVAAVNRLAREMDDKASTIHPSAWAELMKADNEKFRKVAKWAK